jgi:diguanylate cyclase (GGDEF)-like protein
MIDRHLRLQSRSYHATVSGAVWFRGETPKLNYISDFSPSALTMSNPPKVTENEVRYRGHHPLTILIYSRSKQSIEKALPLLQASAFRLPQMRSIVKIIRIRPLLRRGRSVLLLNLLVIAVIGSTASFTIWDNHRSAQKARLTNMNSMGVVLAEQTSRFAQVIDLTLREVQSRIVTLNIATPEDFQSQLATQDFQIYLAERAKNVPQADGIILIGADGLTLNWSRGWPVMRVDARGRDFYNHFRDHDDPGLFIGSLSKGRETGKLSLFFARRVTGSEGRFLGLVLGVVDIRYLIDFYQTVGNRSRQSVTLLRRDGTMLIRYPNPETAIGVKLPQKSPWYARVAGGGGNYFTPGTIDGVPGLVSVHPLAEYPLVIDVLTDKADVFAQWHEESIYIAGFALTGAIAFSCLFWMLARQFRRQADQNARLELGHQQFDAVLSNITQGICLFDAEKRLLIWNQRYEEIYNLPPKAIRIGSSFEAIVGYRFAAGSTPDMSMSDYLDSGNQLAAGMQSSSSIEALRNGRILAICYQPVRGGGWVATHEDITERQLAEESVAFMARHDALTRLPNRVLFRERMEQAIALAGRGTEFAVICLDLDNFKLVNDTLGHPIGDGLLVAVSDRLRTCLREIDTVARLGGDEFAIIQIGVRQPNDAESLASRIIDAFHQPFDVDGHRIMAAASIGITIAPGNSVSYETLMRDADIALYLAKTEGRGTVRFFEPEMDARIHIRRMLELDLQSAITRNEFELYYQPLISLIPKKLIGFEALLRWHHPIRGLVSPLDFIPVAEETGLIISIGEWVLRTACFEAATWPDDLSVAVNLSPVQFKQGDIVATIQAALAASGLRPDRLELEITESVFLRDTVGTLAALHQLRAMGIGVALDDFGTGYSSLSYLHSFPFNKIKIDQSFVRDLMTNKESMSIVRAVIGLGKSLGIKTLAEGVETLEQLNGLRDKGCIEVQGYFFSRPRPASELPSMIERLQEIRDQNNLETV